jgi:hypothetical protein
MQLTSWGKSVSKALKPSLPKTSRHYIARQVKRGLAGVFLIDDVVVVLRGEGSELVVVCAAGKDLFAATRNIHDYAQGNNLNTIRVHTRRQGLFRLLKKWPFKLVEVRDDEKIYRMLVNVKQSV